VLLIDNASTDDTSKVALSCWGEGPAPLRVVREPKLGLQCARERGLKEAKYDFIGFVDDDNWVFPDWVLVANEVLASDPTLGAVGSICEPVFETEEPKWFREFHPIYAILTESDLDTREGEVEYLHGAGLCIRKQAWMQLIRGGFRSLLTDRVGGRLSGGGDTELTLALCHAGWKISMERRLRVQHFMPVQRLRWEYLRRLHRGYEASQVLLDAYSRHSLFLRLTFKSRLGQLWFFQIGRSLLKLAYRPKSVLIALTSVGEHRRDVIEIEQLFGRISGMLRLRSKYSWSRRHVRYAPWRLRRPEEYLRRQREARV
jgi:glycosyltransferase involved in cell wall biosynthesis